MKNTLFATTFVTQNIQEINKLEDKLDNTCDYQPGEFDKNLTDNNHGDCSQSKKNK